MENKYFVASVIGAAGVASVLRGFSGRTKKLSRNRRPSMPPLGANPVTVFQEELQKLKEHLGPPSICGFNAVLTRFEEGLVKESKGVGEQLVQALLLAVLAKNSLEGLSNYVPKGVAFDTILRCELDSASVISEDSVDDNMICRIATLYTYLK